MGGGVVLESVRHSPWLWESQGSLWDLSAVTCLHPNHFAWVRTMVLAGPG